MSAPDMANSARNASGMESRNWDIEGCAWMLGQTATYMATRSTRLTHHAASPRRWSYSVFHVTSRSTVRPLPVVRHEGLLELGLHAAEVEHRPARDLLEHDVQG